MVKSFVLAEMATIRAEGCNTTHSSPSETKRRPPVR